MDHTPSSNHYRNGCRSPECRAAHAAKQRQYRNNQSDSRRVHKEPDLSLLPKRVVMDDDIGRDFDG